MPSPPRLPPSEVLAELQKLAGRVGVAVRYEAFDLRVLEGKGGLCRLRGEPVVVMDAALPVLDKIGVLAEALATFDIDALYVPEPIRRRVLARRPRVARTGVKSTAPRGALTPVILKAVVNEG